MHAKHISKEEYVLYNIWTSTSTKMTSHPKQTQDPAPFFLE
jgi:hypothetical protein